LYRVNGNEQDEASLIFPAAPVYALLTFSITAAAIIGGLKVRCGEENQCCCNHVGPADF
jgi:hypothetical protein